MRSEQSLFDLRQLSEAINEQRTRRRMTWRALSAEVGVAASTIRRFATATDAEADGVLALIGWLGARPEDFIDDVVVEGCPLPPARHGVIRVDMARVDGLSGSAAKPPRSRTTIQRLSASARSQSRSIASLTRWSAV